MTVAGRFWDIFWKACLEFAKFAKSSFLITLPEQLELKLPGKGHKRLRYWHMRDSKVHSFVWLIVV